MRTRRAVQRRAPVCGKSTARPTRAVPPVVSLQPCRAARYACVACRGLGWYLALVALSKQRALLRRATSAAVALPRHAITTRYRGRQLTARGSRRLAASRVSFFCVSRAAVLTCFDGDVNSLVSLQGCRNRGLGGQHALPHL
jgi:hypothetical protein